MKTLKGLERPERQRRHRMIVETFERHVAKNLPWMARTSPNDPDVIVEITDKIREPVGVYTWFNKGDWISVSVSKISQSIDGNFVSIEFGRGNIQIVKKGVGIIINDVLFRSPPELVDIYANLVEDIEHSADKLR